MVSDLGRGDGVAEPVTAGAVGVASGPGALDLVGLQVSLRLGGEIIEHVDLRLAPGEILGVVGESGSGKTTTALALLGYCSPGVAISGGTLAIAGQSLRMDESMRAARGTLVSYVPQNPGLALNPALRVADAIRDVVRVHRPRDEGRESVVYGALETVGLPGTTEFGRRFPHQLSGGQQQRVCIAAALVCEPVVLVLDEPTTGLDVVSQQRILTELRRLRDDKKVSMVYVTHDLAVVAQVADRIAVMYAGRVVEEGPAADVLRRPRHPYTRGLLASIPDHLAPTVLEPMPGIAVAVGERPTGCSFAPRCPQKTQQCAVAMPPLVSIGCGHSVRCIHAEQTPRLRTIPLGAARSDPQEVKKVPVLEVVSLTAEHRSRRETVLAAQDVSFTVGRGDCVALVGESGSGKTTIARVIAGLHRIAAGSVLLAGEQLPSLAKHRTVEQRRLIQLIFQNPADALNPRHTAADAIMRPAQLLRGLSLRQARTEVDTLLEQVRLSARVSQRYPHELAGGERQRVAIARALAAKPDIILCDEITSALDVSVQAAVLKLLNDLRSELGLALLFITHDLGIVATIADDTLVLEGGLVRERGHTTDVLKTPQHPYTQNLLKAAPSVAAAIETWDSTPQQLGGWVGGAQGPVSRPAP